MVTFADMMALLLCLFVLLLSFSEMDVAKFKLVAGEMEQAFGLALKSRLTGMVEFDGSPERRAFKDVRIQKPEEFIPIVIPPSAPLAEDVVTPQEGTPNERQMAAAEQEAFDEAQQLIEQAMQKSAELKEFSDRIKIEMIKDGMRIQIVDQDGGSMFVGGTAELNVKSEEILREIVRIIQRLPNEIAISGHTDASNMETKGGYSNWELSADRANSSRRYLVDAGIPHERIARVVGMADQDPLNDADPFSAENRRISLILLRQAPVLPAFLQRK